MRVYPIQWRAILLAVTVVCGTTSVASGAQARSVAGRHPWKASTAAVTPPQAGPHTRTVTPAAHRSGAPVAAHLPLRLHESIDRVGTHGTQSCDLTPARLHQALRQQTSLALTCLPALLSTAATAHGSRWNMRAAGEPDGAAGPFIATQSITTNAGGLEGGGAFTAYGLRSYSVVADSSGHLLISDGANNVVWLANLQMSTATAYGLSVAKLHMRVVAGDDTAGYAGDGGPATAAALNQPNGVALDAAGNLFIADTANQRIREVAFASGIISTVAGNGTRGFSGDGGPATQAELADPMSVAVGNGGNVYIADSSNNRVRQIVAHTGVIVTAVGTGTPAFGGDGGPATKASLDYPCGVAVGGGGNLYIADTYNNRVRVVTPSTGAISTVAGNGLQGFSGDGGAATRAELNNPDGVAADKAGNIFIADTDNQRIREVASHVGTIDTVAGNGRRGFSGDGGPATQAELALPTGVTTDKLGDLFIADQYNNRIREVLPPRSTIGTLAGNGTLAFGGDGGPAPTGELYQPSAVAVDSAGNLFIADSLNNCIREVITGTGIITTVAGTGTPGYGGDGGLAVRAKLNGPYGVAVDGAGNLFIADTGNNRIREVIAESGVISTVAGTGVAGFSGDGGRATGAELNFPAGVAVDSAGSLLIADTANNRVRTVSMGTNIISTLAGTGVAGFGGDGGPAQAAELYFPMGVSINSVGQVFIADTNNNRIRMVTLSSGTITTVAGDGARGFGGDGGPAIHAALNAPTSVEGDNAGHLFIADRGNNRIRMVVTTNGLISTLAGGGSGCAEQTDAIGDNCPATKAQLDLPAGVAPTPAGQIYVADTANNRVRFIKL